MALVHSHDGFSVHEHTYTMAHGETFTERIDCALARLWVGITKESTPTCDWYESIEFDAFDELVAAIRDQSRGGLV